MLGASAPLRGETPGGSGFDDALVRIATTLEAQPGRDAVRHWATPSKGSVRVVGHLTKTSANANAVFDILVDGHAIWSRALNAQDAIRHGFDVPLCDLAARSDISFRLTAGSGPARVDMALDILPEPQLSRWSPDLTTGYPQWSAEVRAGLRTRGQDILRAIREASANKLGRIVIPPGDYLFHADWSRASTLAGLENLEIVADGVTFWFEPPMVHALLFESCRNVTVRGLSIDFALPCWFQARVADIDRGAKTLRATIAAGYEPRNANGEAEVGGKRALMFYRADGTFINHRHSPGTWQQAEDGKSIVCRDIELAGIPAVLQAGDYVVGTIRTGAALRSVNCGSMRFEDVNVWSSPGMAVNEGGGAGGHVYRRVRATRRPRTNRLQAFGADIFHLAGADRGPVLDRCELAYGADDNLNIHGSFGRVVQRVDARSYYLQGAYAAGDSLEFRDQRSVDLLGVAKVVSVKATPDGPSLPIGDRYQAKGETLVALDTPLELPPLALVVLDGKQSAGGFVLRNCWLHDNFQRTLINGSPGGLIENNTLQNVGHGLAIQFETWGPWMEGPFARDLVIRHNRFLDSPPDAAAISVSMHPPGGGSNARRFTARPVTNLTIIDNDFGRSSTAPLVVHNVDGLQIIGNSIDYPADAPSPVGLANDSGLNWLYLQDCDHVALRGNQTPSAPEARH
ncbi:MAG: hypothetical protein HZB16_10130 [Armatimonadetes bacterium]|nr:hypothetical protein [Armatimonadota bacterium]